jgi:hypothetical protein
MFHRCTDPEISLGALPGPCRYRVTAYFIDAEGNLSPGEAQEAELALMRETIPGS